MGHLKRYWREYLAPHRWAFFKVCLLMGVTGTFAQILGYYGKTMVDSVIRPAAGGGAANWRLYAGLACLYPLTWGTYAFALYRQNILQMATLLKITRMFRFRISEKLSKLSMAYYDSVQTGRIIARLFSDAHVISTATTQLVTSLVSSLIILTVNLTIMLILNWRLTLLTLCILPVYVATYQIFRRGIRRCTERIREQNSRIWGMAQERLAGVQVVKCFRQENREVAAFFRLTGRQLRDIIRRTVLSTTMTTLCGIFYYTGFVAIVWCGAIMLRDHPERWSPGDFLWFNNLCLMNFPALRNIVGMATTWRELRTNLRRVFEVLDERVAIQDPKPGIELREVAGNIRFVNVDLRYPGQPANSLSKIELMIPAGTKVSLLGPSGSGKTSLTRLLQRLYDPTEGCILLDGHNLKDIRLKSLREKVVRVSQETVIFSGTIVENIRYGHLDATNQQVIDAAKAAELHAFVMELPEKYETELGEMGLNLSGGQKQRLSLARALVTDPAILILDDTTSALDAETTARIEKTLARILHGRTAVIITHRLATAMQADRILVLEGGRITESGTHEELLRGGGLYARIYDQQIGRDGADAT